MSCLQRAITPRRAECLTLHTTQNRASLHFGSCRFCYHLSVVPSTREITPSWRNRPCSSWYTLQLASSLLPLPSQHCLPGIIIILQLLLSLLADPTLDVSWRTAQNHRWQCAHRAARTDSFSSQPSCLLPASLKCWHQLHFSLACCV